MSHEIVLFHSGLGLRPAVSDFAASLRGAGHIVHTPDLFDGQVFASMDDGERKRDALGIPELMRRAEEAVAGLRDGIVVAGFSMGAAAAQYLAATHPGVKGALLMHGALPPEAIGVEAWPQAVNVQIHYGVDDSSVSSEDIDRFAALVRRSNARADVHAYAGAAHLFSDSAYAEYEPEAARLMQQRVMEFLAGLP